MSTIKSIVWPLFNKWLLPLGILITLVGYFGPWVNHRVAGLVVMGLDLGEYVKFLPPVRNGQISLWREGFYLPLITASLASSLYAFAYRTTADQNSDIDQGVPREEARQPIYHWVLRVPFVIIAIVAALNMLPPAWAPWKLRLPEFQLQTMLLIFCLVMMLISPFLGLIPRLVRSIAVTILALLSIGFPVVGFWRVLPTISELYNQTVWPGWGMYVMIAGLLLLVVGAWQANKSIQPQANIQPVVNSQLVEEAA